MCRSFNGTNQDIGMNTAAINASGNQALTIACWIRGSAAGAANGSFWAQANSAAAGPYFAALGDPGGSSGKWEMNMRSATSGSGDQPLSNNIVLDSSWHHICCSQPSGSAVISMYTDGLLDRTFSRTFSSSTSQTFNTLHVGKTQRNTDSNFLNGSVAELAIWTRTLSAKEIAALGKGLPPSFLAPLHYWPLWGVDSPEPDLGSGTHVGGSLTNSPTKGTGGPPIYPNLAVLL